MPFYINKHLFYHEVETALWFQRQIDEYTPVWHLINAGREVAFSFLYTSGFL